MRGEVDILQRVMKAKTDVEAADRLIADYMPYIKSHTERNIVRVPKEGSDDELSIAMMAFHEAIEGYSRGRGAFLKFAALVIKRRLIDYGRREKRFAGNVSLSTSVSDDDSLSIEDTISDSERPHEELHARDDFKREIEELTVQLSGFGITLSDVAASCPRQERTLKACRDVLLFVMKNPALTEKLRETKKLPMTEIHHGSGVEKKTLERHRKYIVTLLLIYSNGYDSIRAHLKQIFRTEEGGMKA